MDHQHVTRNPRPRGSRMRKTLQYALLSAVCVWLLYQAEHSLHRDDVNVSVKLREDQRFSSVLGRKGKIGSSLVYRDDVDLYGMDLVRAAENIKHMDRDDNKPNEDNVSNSDDPIMSLESSTEDREIPEQIESVGTAILSNNEVTERDSAPSRRSDVEVKNLNPENVSSIQKTKDYKPKCMGEFEGDNVESEKRKSGSMREIL